MRFQPIDVPTAKELIEILRLGNDDWATEGNEWNRKWFFRGQANPLDAQGNPKWELKPSAWRDDVMSPKLLTSVQRKDFYGEVKEIYKRNPVTNATAKQWIAWADAVMWAYVEYRRIRIFAKLADRFGYVLPRLHDFMNFEERFVVKYSNYVSHNSRENIWEHPIVALAQHHGVPTRLLDWTENSLIAALFAIVSYQNLNPLDKQNTKHIVVYAVHKKSSDKALTRIAPHRGENVYLQAQQGMFLIAKNAEAYYAEHKVFPPLDCEGKVYSLPISEIPELTRLLWLEGITQAHLTPNLDSVAKSAMTLFSNTQGEVVDEI